MGATSPAVKALPADVGPQMKSFVSFAERAGHIYPPRSAMLVTFCLEGHSMFLKKIKKSHYHYAVVFLTVSCGLSFFDRTGSGGIPLGTNSNPPTVRCPCLRVVFALGKGNPREGSEGVHLHCTLVCGSLFSFLLLVVWSSSSYDPLCCLSSSDECCQVTHARPYLIHSPSKFFQMSFQGASGHLWPTVYEVTRCFQDH